MAAPAARLTWENVMAWRLHRQHLRTRAARGSALAVAASICGLHAQVLSSAALTLWARVEDLDPGIVSKALWEERSLVKTWAMRGTLHLLPAAELPLWVAAQGSLKSRQHTARWLRYYGLACEEMDSMLAAISKALDGRALTREALADEVTEITGSADLGGKLRGNWGMLLKPAAFRGDLCFAPNDGQLVRFARPDQWLGQFERVEGDRAIQEITRRYLAAYGPATREEFARWFGSTSPAQAGALIQRLGETVVPVEVEGASAWMLAEDVMAAAESSPTGSVRLLPAFDQYVVTAPRDMPAILPAALKGRVYRPQGWFSPVLLVDGRMDGIWRHERRGDRLAVRIEPFAPPPIWVRRAAEEEAERLARFLGGRLVLSWG